MKLDNVQQLIDERLNSSSPSFSEDEAKKIFKLYNIPVVEERFETDDNQVVQACIETGFPIVLKGAGKNILHKTESGLVRLGLSSETQIKDAVLEMRSKAGNDLEGFLIQPQISGKREFVAGMFKDKLFGPVIVFGLGGVLTEALEDITFKVAPLDDVDIEEMFEEISSKKLLGEFRGEKAVNKSRIKDVLRSLSDISLAYPDIKEIDINPLIMQPDGSPVAVDGLIVLEKAPVDKQKNYSIDFQLLGKCFYPKSVAFIGASATMGKWGYLLLTNTLSRNYEGDVYFVNPKGGTILEQDVYKRVEDIEQEVELAVVTVPAAKVLDLIPGLKKKNIKAMLLISSGFREVGGDGIALEEKLVEEAKKAGILVLGPNTMGVCNPHNNFYCTGSPVHPIPGSTVLVCQSGNMGTQLMGFAAQQDIGIRSFSGSGNEAMVTIEDYMEAFEIDELTRTVVLYIESVKNGRRFFESAKRVSKKKPVVVLKGGRTKEGEKAASSHTGAMASDIKVFDAACKQSGVIQVNQPMELLDLSAVFSSLPLPKGNRVAIMTLGGGWGVVATDLCAENGLVVPNLSQDIIKRLDKILPAFWSRENPVDIVGERDTEIPMVCMEELLKWDGCDAVIHLGIHGRRILGANMLRASAKADPAMDEATADIFIDELRKYEDNYIKYMAELTEKYEKPVLGVSLLTDEDTRTLYRVENNKYKGVFFPSPERAVKALWGMCQYSQWRKNHES